MSLAIVVIATISAKAQAAQEGSILLYGNLDFTSSKDASGNKTSNFSIMPGIGYQFNDKWTAGLNIGIGSSSRTENGGASQTTTSFNVGPFLRCTHTLSNIFSVYGQLDLGFLSTTYPSPEPSSSGFVARIWPAVAINVNNGFALNFAFGGISYESSKVSGASNSASSFDLTFGSGASFGVSKNFGGHKEKK